MKLRIQGNSLRLRLTRSEVAALDRNGAVEESAQFAAGNRLTYRIGTLAGSGGMQAELTGGTVAVHVPAGAVAAWAASDEVGLNGRDGPLRIAIEKDFRCLTRAGAEEPDAFPHPAEQPLC